MIKQLIYWFALYGLVCTLNASEVSHQNWQCEQDLALQLRPVDYQQIELIWQGKRFQLLQQITQSGAQRYFDERSGMDLVIIPSKLMLFNRKQGTRLADNCQTFASR